MIYTKTGDKGQTSLANGQRVAKTDVRIEAYGTVDELNSWIGALRVVADDSQLEWIQNKLFNLGAELSDAPGEGCETVRGMDRCDASKNPGSTRVLAAMRK